MWRVFFILCSISVSSCVGLVDKQVATINVFDERLSNILQKALGEAARIQQADSLSASLYINDRCYWLGTTGVTKQTPGIPISSDMIFGFASITKTFVATIVMLLVEENKLELEDPLGKWLERFPNIDPNITLRQLLNHGSGLNGYLNSERFWSISKAEPDRIWLPEELLSYVGSPLKLSGFDIPSYSNTNYILLGLIVEAATGNSLEQELQKRIFNPLHLDNTYLPKNHFEPDRWANSTALHNSLYSGVWAAGAIASTPRDMAKFSQTLFSGKILQADTLESMLVTEPRRIGRIGLPMGLGVWQMRVEDHPVWGHGGLLLPFVARMFYLPEFEISVAYSSSTADASTQYAPGSHLMRAYIDNRPDDISMCFDS